MSSLFKIKKLSLRVRILISMVLLTLLASVLMAAISIYQFKQEAKEYHRQRLERKESAIRDHIYYILENTTYPITTENIPLIFKDRIYELSDIHSLEINLYDLEGSLLKSSRSSFATDSIIPPVTASVLKLVASSIDKRYVEIKNSQNARYRASYSQINDKRFKPIALLNLPYIEDEGYYERESERFLVNLAQVYTIMFLIAFLLAYFLSSYITKSIKDISDRITITRLNRKNEKIQQMASSSEIQLLVDAYNSMIDELEASAIKLAQSEREEAWREMAKQVAHEIKNPLTPMRLTVQNFQRKFDPVDPEILIKLDDYTKTLLQQIDTMSSIANAFSNFASMPAQQNDTINVVQIIHLALEIFNENYIVFESSEDEIIAKMDRTQLIRIITNLVKNAIQAIPAAKSNPLVKVCVTQNNHNFTITVEDNGIGISTEQQAYIFEPKFTTKSSGMGLGLGIIKKIIENYEGSISFTSKPNVGTLFTVKFPIETNPNT